MQLAFLYDVLYQLKKLITACDSFLGNPPLKRCFTWVEYRILNCLGNPTFVKWIKKSHVFYHAHCITLSHDPSAHVDHHREVHLFQLLKGNPWSVFSHRLGDHMESFPMYPQSSMDFPWPFWGTHSYPIFGKPHIATVPEPPHPVALAPKHQTCHRAEEDQDRHQADGGGSNMVQHIRWPHDHAQPLGSPSDKGMNTCWNILRLQSFRKINSGSGHWTPTTATSATLGSWLKSKLYPLGMDCASEASP